MKKNNRKIILESIYQIPTNLCPQRFLEFLKDDTHQDQTVAVWNKEKLEKLKTQHMKDLLRLIEKKKIEVEQEQEILATDVDREISVNAATKIRITMYPGNEMRIEGHSDRVVMLFCFDRAYASLKDHQSNVYARMQKAVEEKRDVTEADEIPNKTEMDKLATTLEYLEACKNGVAYELREEMKAAHKAGAVKKKPVKKIIQPASPMTVVKPS